MAKYKVRTHRVVLAKGHVTAKVGDIVDETDIFGGGVNTGQLVSGGHIDKVFDDVPKKQTQSRKSSEKGA